MITKGVAEYYRFFEREEGKASIEWKSGQKLDRYDLGLDNLIIKELMGEDVVLRSNELKTRIEKSLGHEISPDTFYRHCDVLVDHKLIDRQAEERRGKVLYSLTDNAKSLVKLNLLGCGWEEIKKSRRIYEIFFLYEVLHYPSLVLETEQKFSKFLSDLEVKEKDIDWGIIREQYYNKKNVDLIYGNNKEPLSFIPKETLNEYWEERKGMSYVSDIIKHHCYPLENRANRDVEVERREYWTIDKRSGISKQRTDYIVILPGVSLKELVNELTNDKLARELNTTPDDVEKALETLKQMNLIGRALFFRGHTRYKIKDENLRALITHLRTFYEKEYNLLYFKWKYFETLSPEELKRWESLLGEKRAKQILDETSRTRFDKRTAMNRYRTVEEYHQFLKKNCPPEYNQWPTDYVLDDFKKQRELKKMERDEEQKKKALEKGKKWKGGKRGTKKDLKDDIKKYDEYLLNKLIDQIRFLPVNLENEGIEELKMTYADTIDRYPYLQAMIKKVCPMAFEPDNDEIQSAIIMQRVDREFANQQIARDLNAIDFEDAPYTIFEYDDPRTGKRVKQKVFDLTPEYEGKKY